MAGVIFDGKTVAPAIVVEKEISKTKFGIDIDCLVADLDENGIYKGPFEDWDGTYYKLDMSKFKGINKNAGLDKFPNTNVSTYSKSVGMAYAFYGRLRLGGTIDLSWYGNNSDNLTAVLEGTFAHTSVDTVILPFDPEESSERLNLLDTFANCPLLKKIIFNSTVLGGSSAPYLNLENAFKASGDDNGNVIEIVGLDKITAIRNNGLKQTFYQTKNLQEDWVFTSLQEVSGSSALYQTWGSASSIKTGAKRFYFPALTVIDSDSFNSSYSSYYPWYSNKLVEEIHFRADMQATVEALGGYKNKFGATSSTIYFDL